MKIKNEHLAIIVTFLCILFRYLNIWGFISSGQRYLVLPIIFGLLIFNVLTFKFSKKSLYRIVFIFFVSFLDFLLEKEIDILIALILGIAFFKEDNKTFFASYAFSSLFFFCLTIVMSKFGIIHGNDTVRIVNGVITERFSLGFPNVNHVFAFIISVILCIYLFLDNKKKHILIFNGITLVITYILYRITDCRTGFYSVLIFCGLTLFDEFFFKHFRGMLPFMFLIFTLISFAMGLYFGNNNIFNMILTNRPSNCATVIHEFSISIFGNRKASVDNNYLFLLYRHGLLIYFFYLFIFVNFSKIAKNNKKLFISTLIILVYGLFENVLNYAFNAIFIIEIIYYLKDFDNWRISFSERNSVINNTGI